MARHKIEKTFKTALILSLVFHLIAITFLPGKLLNTDRIRSPQIKTEFISPKNEFAIRKAISLLKPVKKAPPYLDMKKQMLGLKPSRNLFLKKPKINKGQMASKEIIFTKPKEKLDSLPAYINYYDNIRRKIRETAYSYYNISKSGRVFLNFTIDKSGKLINVSIDGNKSSAEEGLKNKAVKSIKDSVPFPSFPPDLKQFESLTFSLSIYFKSN